MKKPIIAALAIGIATTTAALAQTQIQNTSNGTTSQSGQRNTSSTEGLQRKGGEKVGTRGSQKMKDGVSRSGNSNLSPTSPTNAPGGGTNNKSAAEINATGKGAATPQAGNSQKSSGSAAKPERVITPKQQPAQSGASARNGNVGNGSNVPVQTQGSTSEGSASVPSTGGSVRANTREARSVKPKSRAAAMQAADQQEQPTAAGQANSAQQTGANGKRSQGSRPTSLTKRGQQEGSYSDAAKRNKMPEGKKQ
jgi:hypothetical protein